MNEALQKLYLDRFQTYRMKHFKNQSVDLEKELDVFMTAGNLLTDSVTAIGKSRGHWAQAEAWHQLNLLWPNYGYSVYALKVCADLAACSLALHLPLDNNGFFRLVERFNPKKPEEPGTAVMPFLTPAGLIQFDALWSIPVTLTEFSRSKGRGKIPTAAQVGWGDETVRISLKGIKSRDKTPEAPLDRADFVRYAKLEYVQCLTGCCFAHTYTENVRNFDLSQPQFSKWRDVL